jgi:NTE family protein
MLPAGGGAWVASGAMALDGLRDLPWLRKRRRTRPPDRVAFVLSGGGNLGAVQVGMLRALMEHRIVPDLIVGCSVGALNGAALADEPNLVGVARLEQVWRSLDGNQLMPRNWMPNAVTMARKGEAVHDNDGLRRLAEDVVVARSFADLKVPFECVATDVDHVDERWFTVEDGSPLIDAVLASSAMPALYPSVVIDEHRYLDGAIVNDVPVVRAVEQGARTLYVLQVGSFSRPRAEPRRPFDVAVQAYWIARHHRYKRDLASIKAMGDVTVHVLPHGQPPVMRYNDFTHTAHLITSAYEASSAYLDGRPVPDGDGGGDGEASERITDPSLTTADGVLA